MIQVEFWPLLVGEGAQDGMVRYPSFGTVFRYVLGKGRIHFGQIALQQLQRVLPCHVRFGRYRFGRLSLEWEQPQLQHENMTEALFKCWRAAGRTFRDPLLKCSRRA